MVLVRLCALALVVADAVNALPGQRPVGYVNTATDYMGRPEVQRQLNRVKRAVENGERPYFDVHIPPDQLGGPDDVLVFAKGGDEVPEWSSPEAQKNASCSSNHWYYRQGMAPDKSAAKTVIKSLSSQDYEIVNTNYVDALTFHVSQSKAKVLSSAAHWSIENSGTKASEKGSTVSQEDSHATSKDSSNTVGGSVEAGANGLIFSGKVEAHADHTWSESQSSTSSQSQSRTQLTSTSHTISGGKGQDDTTSNEFTTDVSIESECPKRSICTVQTWTFSVKITGRCPRIVFYDFEPCLRQANDATVYMIPMDEWDRRAIRGKRRNLSPIKLEPQVKYPAKLALSAINMNLETWDTKVRLIWKQYFNYVKWVTPKYWNWDGLIMHPVDSDVRYGFKPRCDVVYPALQADGTPHRVQFLFVDSLDVEEKVSNNTMSGDEESVDHLIGDGKKDYIDESEDDDSHDLPEQVNYNKRHIMKRNALESQTQVSVLWSTLD